MIYTATYSPEDNKLRFYASARLDAETYSRVKAAGFIWAPKQDLFVAPMWTPGREDLLIELAGEIDDEDSSLVDRAEQRADRFSDYKESRIEDAQRAQDAVHRIADNIPFGQPILVGHHSERHARKDAERIESGMRKTVQMWQTARYWEQRAAGALRHAKYKALPGVRHRRIKGLEADKRKQERNKQEAEMWLKLWTKCANEPDKELQEGCPSHRWHVPSTHATQGRRPRRLSAHPERIRRAAGQFPDTLRTPHPGRGSSGCSRNLPSHHSHV